MLDGFCEKTASRRKNFQRQNLGISFQVSLILIGFFPQSKTTQERIFI